ncbi:MAG TPA: type II toxin-antitoxin system VapC family toxin [Solirubrobacterales bacterium]|nr:type II toxin-antitoxin system VapC family toxin [Solirubrobacterales bacterium]
MALVYIDASALVKVVRDIEEEGAAALREFLQGADLVSSELVLTEVPRALQRTAAERPRFQLEPALQRAAEVLDSLALRPVDDSLLVGAGLFGEPLLRSLDAIHVVTALLISPIDSFVTYDKRQAAAARRAGLQTVAPGADD